jgi:hypothetical protein
MGVFFEPVRFLEFHDAANPAIQRSKVPPPVPPAQAKAFKGWRFLGAMLFLAVVFGAGIYCAHDPQLQEWSKVLLHAFEVLLGAVIGIVIGEQQD